MKRYKVPRIAFINKLDRMGANPWKVLTYSFTYSFITNSLLLNCNLGY